MRFCQDHWDKLRDALEARDILHLASMDGEAAALRLKHEMEGIADDVTFNPLMHAFMLASTRAVKYLGLYLLTGDYCPVCEWCEHTDPPPEGHRYPTNEAFMIDGLADHMLDICKEKGLVDG